MINPDCWCITCDADYTDKNATSAIDRFRMRMNLCPECGNKRCPRATDHRLDCTGSNESGQPGSAYQ